MNDHITKPPTSFWIISAVALIWNIMGFINFISQTFMSEESLAALPEEQQTLFESVPMWMTVIFAIAVISGTLGCLGLLLRKAWAIPIFLISLITILIQMLYALILSDMVAVMGTPAVVTSILVIIVAIFLYFYAKKCKEKGWIT